MVGHSRLLPVRWVVLSCVWDVFGSRVNGLELWSAWHLIHTPHTHTHKHTDIGTALVNVLTLSSTVFALSGTQARLLTFHTIPGLWLVESTGDRVLAPFPFFLPLSHNIRPLLKIGVKGQSALHPNFLKRRTILNLVSITLMIEP